MIDRAAQALCLSTVVQGGNVGVPRKGEKVCPACGGTGHDPKVGYQLMGGCDHCSGTGVVPILDKVIEE